MNRKMEISPEKLLKRFARQESYSEWKNKLSTPQLSDALKDLLDYIPVIPGIKPIKDEYKILGKIITVSTCAYDWGTPLKAIEMAEKGDILFINADKDDVAVWGELTSKNASYKGIGGTIIYGATRDVAEIRELNYPVFSKSIVPNAGYPRGEGEINVPLQYEDITVNPGDVALGDECGVVVVPGELFPQALRKAMQIKEDEKKIAKKVDEGYSLASIFNK